MYCLRRGTAFKHSDGSFSSLISDPGTPSLEGTESVSSRLSSKHLRTPNLRPYETQECCCKNLTSRDFLHLDDVLGHVDLVGAEEVEHVHGGVVARERQHRDVEVDA